MKRWISALNLTLVLILGLGGSRAVAQQMFKPAEPNPEKKSAFLIFPLSENQKTPAGWSKDGKPGHGNCRLAGYVMVGGAGAEPLKTTSYKLPKGNYDVSVCLSGKGLARIAGTEKWVPVSSKGNAFQFAKIGAVEDADVVSVEVKPDGMIRYAGLLAEGDKLPILPVANVLKKMRSGEPVTICLLGDSVTENAKGHRGGSRAAGGKSAFDNGNPGLLKRRLEEEFKTEVGYISHREPPGWPEDGDINKITVVDINGQKYRDGRVKLDETKKIRLVNMGKGGAASHDGWFRCQPEFTEPNDWRKNARGAWMDTYDTKLPPVLRTGLLGYKPDLAIVNFGTNDANGSHRNWTAEDYLFHTKVLATMLQQRGVTVILTTPHKWTRGTHQSPNTQVEMTDAVRRYARQSGVALADIYNEYKRGEGSTIHPNNAGHAHMVDAYMKAILGQPSKPASPIAAAAAEQFKDNGDGTVTDAKTELVWTKDANPAKEKMLLADAKKLLATWNAEKKLGRNDWRLPTQMELLALTDLSRSKPALPKGVPFENVAREYLTDSVGMALKNRGNYMWLVDMQFGQEFFSNKNAEAQKGYLWPVAGGKKGD